MKDKFFEGEDFGERVFKALIPKYYPAKYKKYIKEETQALERRLKGTNRVLEAGVGIGRLISVLAPIVEEFVGVDNANLMLKESKKVATKFSNVRIVKGRLENLSKLFSKNYFNYSLCIWNTLGNVKDEVKVLKEIAKVTEQSIIVTVYHKGTLKDRKEWYRKVGVEISKIDEENEIFYSKSGLKSKSYSLEDMKEIAECANLRIVNSEILGGVILWVEITR